MASITRFDDYSRKGIMPRSGGYIRITFSEGVRRSMKEESARAVYDHTRRIIGQRAETILGIQSRQAAIGILPSTNTSLDGSVASAIEELSFTAFLNTVAPVIESVDVFIGGCAEKTSDPYNILAQIERDGCRSGQHKKHTSQTTRRPSRPS